MIGYRYPVQADAANTAHARTCQTNPKQLQLSFKNAYNNIVYTVPSEQKHPKQLLDFLVGDFGEVNRCEDNIALCTFPDAPVVNYN